MRVFVEMKDKKYNSEFLSMLWKNPEDYGNGIYMDIWRDGKEFKYVDCRYITNFNEEEILKNVLKSYFGNNIVSITKLED